MSIECVGMDGKKTPLEEEEQMAKLVGGTLSPINIAMNAMRKFGSFRVRPCSFTRNDDVAVVCIADKPQSSCSRSRSSNRMFAKSGLSGPPYALLPLSFGKIRFPSQHSGKLGSASTLACPSPSVTLAMSMS